MNKIKAFFNYFSRFELILWGSSTALIITAYLIFDRGSVLSLIASVIGVAGLIFNAKGNPVGQGLFIIFSILYTIISFGFAYYGEMITYLGMSLPMAIISLVGWLRNPFKNSSAEVTVGTVKKNDVILLAILTAAVTVSFYFILGYFNTANLIPSTLSVATSFAAAFLTYKRSPWFALLYALNDAVLIVLWTLALFENLTYVCVVVCFVAFLFNDSYAFFNWQKIRTRQAAEKAKEQ